MVAPDETRTGHLSLEKNLNGMIVADSKRLQMQIREIECLSFPL